jgi:hypothetical protein
MTVLVEKLLESEELQVLSEALPDSITRERLEKRRRDCENIIHYLMDRFASLNERFSRVESEHRFAAAETGPLVQDEVRAMNDAALLRYGRVLKYICCAEAELQDLPLEECKANFRLAQAEWQRRFGSTILEDSV